MGTQQMALSGLALMVFAIGASSLTSRAQEDGRGRVAEASPPASEAVASEALAPKALATPSAIIDYDGFLTLAADVEPYRAERLVSLDDFRAMAAVPGTIILDARSAEAFTAGHMDGAINLPFSDFTAEKLAAVLGSPDTRILIYCNNNFADNAPPVMLKSAPLALNVPTFVNLYGYGYRNVYELADLVDTSDPRVGWVSSL